jgi:hypothetical protein
MGKKVELSTTVRGSTQQLNIEYQSVCRQWNYKIRPRLAGLCDTTQTPAVEEVLC